MPHLHHCTTSLYPLTLQQSHEVVTSVGCTLKEDSKSLQVRKLQKDLRNPLQPVDELFGALSCWFHRTSEESVDLKTFHASWNHTDLSQPPALAVKDLFQILLLYAKPGTSHQNTLHSHHMTWRVWDLKSGQMLCCVWVFLGVLVSLWGFQTNDSWLMRTPVFLWLNSVSDNHSPSFALHSQPAPAAVVRRQGCDKSDGRTPKACAEEDWKISHFSTQVIGINDQQPVWASESLKYVIHHPMAIWPFG